jgi:Peptidase family M23
MPPRPHPLVLAALAFGCVVVMALVMPRGLAGAAGWRWPLRGPVVGNFHVSPPAPFARGQRRGIDVSAPAGAPVRAACGGRVTFAGALPRRGLAVSVRCGALVATYLGLGRLAVRAGARVGPGAPVGALGRGRRLRLGARRVGDRRGYLDPLSLLGDDVRQPRPLGPAPRHRFHRPLPATAPALLPAPAPSGPPATPHRPVPWPAYPAVALVASALPVGGLVRRRRRERRRTRSATVPSAPPLRSSRPSDAL